MKPKKSQREQIIQLLVDKRLRDKLTIYDMTDFVMTQFGYKQSYAYELVRDARNKIADIYKNWNENLLDQTIGDLEQQKRQAEKDGNRKLVLEITKEINKISGLYVERVDVTGNIEHSINVIKIISPPEKPI